MNRQAHPLDRGGRCRYLGRARGNMLAKELSFLANADAAGIVLGARVPIILTSRADSVRARMASCAVAALCVRAQARITT